jgi:broad specificity phosphatase PhoE
VILVRHGQSYFNLHFGATRVDPGIPDPELTGEGRQQARAAAEELRARPVRRLIVSPYTRTLQTAHIIAEILDLPITVEPLVRERMAFTCDIGTTPAELGRRWPRLAFDHLEERWWGHGEESETALQARCVRFRAAMAKTPDWPEVAVVTHWGFIRGLTGQTLVNGAQLAFDPTAAPAL